MELSFAHQTERQISVTCNGQPSHTFDLQPIMLKSEEELFSNHEAYGEKLYEALFPPETPARHALDAEAERVLLVAPDDDLDAIPWEYIHGPNGFLVQELHFVRGLPAEQRLQPPLLDTGLHIIAVPSNPLSSRLASLNINAEWTRLKEIVEEIGRSLHCALTLERTRPPTLEQVRNAVSGQRHRVMHFMGHGGQVEQGAVLCFEQENGGLDLVDAKKFALLLRGTVFLVTLNACASAAPGPAPLSNLAATLVRLCIPYALGMRFSIPDEDARAFSRTFYNDLARGTPVEEALLQARLTLSESSRRWAIGVPVLYTSLAEPTCGFTHEKGELRVIEHQPRMEVSTLPRAEGRFQGRIEDLKRLGGLLTGDTRPRTLTIHGGGGQGKTALAREAVERFAYAWPGGVWATTLEYLPSREMFVTDLARFLDISFQEIIDPAEIERRVLYQLARRRTLIVLDNAETLVEAVDSNDAAALHLSQLLQQLPTPMVSLLATSRVLLNWRGEVSLELGGLMPAESAELFRQSTSHHITDIERELTWDLSERLGGHPLSLYLLGKAFSSTNLPLQAFVRQYDEYLMQAKDKYKDQDHRHRTLYACIDTSVRTLDATLFHLFSNLWLFHASILPDIAAAIFSQEHVDTIFSQERVDTENEGSSIYNQLYRFYEPLYALWQRGLLSYETVTFNEGTLHLFRLLPVIRQFIETYIAQPNEREPLLLRFGLVYAKFVRYLSHALQQSNLASFLAIQCHEDLERAAILVSGIERGYYLLNWGEVQQQLGNRRHGLKLTEYALEIGQGQDQRLMLLALNNIAVVYQAIGQRQQALALLEQALPLHHAANDSDGESTTLNHMANVYRAIGRPQQALALYEQALPLIRETGNRLKEAVVLSNMADVYRVMGQPQQALALLEQALPLIRETGNRQGEATVLNTMANVYRAIGRPQQALALYEQALPLIRETGDRAGEAAILTNMAVAHRVIGQLQQALTLYERALPIRREVEDLPGEASTLNNMAELHRMMGQLQQALELHKQALPLRREVSDRPGEATTLANMALVYHNMGQLQQAEELYRQALPLQREVSDRSGEAITLSNIAAIYREMGQIQQALVLYEQALPLARKAGDREKEIIILHGLASLFQDMKRYEEAQVVLEQSVVLAQAIGSPAHVISGLVEVAFLIYQHLPRPKEAIVKLEQAIALFRETGLLRDDTGHTVEDLQNVLLAIRAGAALKGVVKGISTLSTAQIQQLVTNTIAVMTEAQDRRTEWREVIVNTLQKAQQFGAEWQIEVDFYTALLSILSEQAPNLPPDHPYAEAVAAIQNGIAAGKLLVVSISDEVMQAVSDFINAEDWKSTQQIVETRQELLFQPVVETLFDQNIAQSRVSGDQRATELLKLHLALLRECKANGIAEAFERIIAIQQENLPFPADLIPRSIVALSSGPQEKMAHMQYLATQTTQITDERLKALITAIQLALFGSDLSQLGQNLSGMYQQAWETIVAEVKARRGGSS